MPRFPVDAPKRRVIKTFELLGFHIVREREHIAMVRENPDGTRTPLTMPNHTRIKGPNVENDLHTSEYPAKRLPECLWTSMIECIWRRAFCIGDNPSVATS